MVYVAWTEGAQAGVNAGVCLISKQGKGGTGAQVKRAVAAVM